MVMMIVHFLARLPEHPFHNVHSVYELDLDSSKPNFKHVTKALYIFHFIFLYIFFLYIHVAHISTCLSIHIPFYPIITLHIYPLSIHGPISLYDNSTYTPSFYLQSFSILLFHHICTIFLSAIPFYLIISLYNRVLLCLFILLSHYLSFIY